MRPLFFIATPLVALIVRESSCKKADTIVWSEGKKLEWQNFKSDSFPGINISALSAIGIKLDYKVTYYLDWFQVHCVFYKNHSVARKDKTEYLLSHEQGHFDIGEIYTREIRRAILHSKKQVNRENYNMIDSIYRYWEQKMKEENSLYDKETDFSLDSVQQVRWNIEIRRRLDELDAFKSHSYKF